MDQRRSSARIASSIPALGFYTQFGRTSAYETVDLTRMCARIIGHAFLVSGPTSEGVREVGYRRAFEFSMYLSPGRPRLRVRL